VVRLIARFAFQQAERIHTGEFEFFARGLFSVMLGFYVSATARAGCVKTVVTVGAWLTRPVGLLAPEPAETDFASLR